MAYFVKVGAIPSNKSGIGSRGFHIYRRGSHVFTVWGPVEVRRLRLFFWAQTTQFKSYRCSSTAAAIRKRKALIEERSEKRGYSRLPTGVRIRRYARSALSRRQR